MSVSPTIEAQVALPSPFAASPVHTSVGVNLEELAYYSTSLPTLDLMKSASPWALQSETSDNTGEKLDLDGHGWVRSIPTANVAVIGVLGENPAAPPHGHYVVLYQGEGILEGTLGTNVIASVSTPGHLVIEAADDGSVRLQLSSTDPAHTGNYIRDMAVVREDLLPLYQAGLTFNPAFLDKVENFHTYRFMDWMDTNKIFDKSGAEVIWDSEVGYAKAASVQSLDWADRPHMSDAQWSRGVPVEALVELANRAGSDVWFNMPTNASDDYVRGFASYVHDHLRPDLKIHVEYSNEVWNWGFLQSGYADAHAKEAFGADGNWMEWYGMRAAQIGQIWHQTFGEPATGSDTPGRVSMVYNTQFAWKGLEEYGLETEHWTDANGNHIRAADYFNEYAVTGYYGDLMSDDAEVAKIKSWWSDPDGGYGKAIAELKDVVSNYNAPLYSYHAGAAQQYGLKLVTYESGFGVVAPDSERENEAYTDFLIKLQSHPEIYNIEMQNYAAFENAGGSLYMNYLLIGSPSKFGSWGALESVTQDNSPRYQALMDMNASAEPLHESGRDQLAFQNALTSLTEVANNFYFHDSSGSAATLKFSGAPVVAGQFDAWTPISAEQTASGYEVARKVPGADQYTIWNTDSNGNFISSIGAVSGSSFALESRESSFHHDLNGDGVIGLVNAHTLAAEALAHHTLLV